MKPENLLRFVVVLLLFASAAPLLSQSSSSDYARKEIIKFGGNVHVQTNESVRNVVVIGADVIVDGKVGDLVVVFGSATINGTVQRDLVVIGGVVLNGTAERDMVVVMGSALCGTNAVVKGDTVVVGGVLDTPPGADLRGERVEIALTQVFPEMHGLRDWLRTGLLLGRPLPPQVGWAWIAAGMFAFIYLILALLFPTPLRLSVQALESRPSSSFFVGALTCVLIGPVLILLIASVAGLIVIPFLFCGVAAAFLFGKAAVLQFCGRQVGRQMGVAALQSPLVAVLLGAVILAALYMIPFLGFLVWGLATLFGVGAVVLALFSALGHEKGDKLPRPAPPVPVAAGGAVPVNTLDRLEVESPAGGSPATGSATAATPPRAVPGAAPNFLAFERAGFWVRLGAMLLDLVLAVVVARLFRIGFPEIAVIWLAYHVIMWTWKGTTVGGLALGLRLIRIDGRPVTFAVALVRALGSILSAVAFFLGFFWAGWDREKQSWHDKIAGTYLVRVPKEVLLL